MGPNYRRVLASSAASNLADGIFVIVLPLLALRLTDSPALIAGVSVAGRLPWLTFVLVAGALADRLDRRVTMRNVQVARVIIVAGLAGLALGGQLSLAVLYVAAFVLGVCETLFDTAAQSLVPTIVPPEQLTRANGRLYAVELMMNQFVGPPLGGVLVALSVPLALGGSALGFAIAATGLTLVTGTFRPERDRATSLARDIRDGLTYMLHHRLLRTLAIMVGVMNFGSSAILAVLVVYAVRPGPMGLDEAGYGILIASFAIGSVVGSALAGRVERLLGQSGLLFLAVGLFAVANAIPAFTAEPWIIGATFALGGAVMMMWNVVTVSLRQRVAPNELLGRVNAGYRLFAWGTQPLGALAGGLIAEAVGVPAVFLGAGVLTALLLIARVVVTDEAIAAAELDGAAARVAAGTA